MEQPQNQSIEDLNQTNDLNQVDEPPKNKKKTKLIITVVVAVLVIIIVTAAVFFISKNIVIPGIYCGISEICDSDEPFSVEGVGPYCSDGFCDTKENWKICPKDCSKPPKPVCGDRVCEEKERKTCPQDCPTQNICGDNICGFNENCEEDCEEPPPTQTNCGNLTCDSGETCNNCPGDCGSCSTQSSGGSHLGTGPVISLSSVFKNARLELYDPQGFKINKGGSWINNCEEFCNTDCTQEKTYCEFSDKEELRRFFKERTPEAYNVFESPIATIHVGDYLDDGATFPRGHEQEYINFLEVLVEEYSDKIKYWTVQNEVENPRFWQGTMEGYSNLVELASEVIKRKCLDCKVGIGLSFLYTPPGRRTQIGPLQNSCSYFDFIDAHVYPDNWYQIDEYENIINDWAGWLNGGGCGEKEFISLETGIWGQTPPGDIGGSEEKQAQDAVKISVILMELGFSKISWNPCDEPGSEWGSKFDHIGMLTQNCSVEKKEYYSLKNLIEKIDVFTSVEKITDTQYKFTVNGKDVYVLWCEDGVGCTPPPISGTISVTDYLGGEMFGIPNILTDSPIFIE